MAETTELKKSDFYFDLPQELIAQDPLEDRSSSRLLVLDKNTGELSHHIFRDIIDYLHPGDCLVLNNTKVIPARLLGEREGWSSTNSPEPEASPVPTMPMRSIWHICVISSTRQR